MLLMMSENIARNMYSCQGTIRYPTKMHLVGHCRKYSTFCCSSCLNPHCGRLPRYSHHVAFCHIPVRRTPCSNSSQPLNHALTRRFFFSQQHKANCTSHTIIRTHNKHNTCTQKPLNPLSVQPVTFSFHIYIPFPICLSK